MPRQRQSLNLDVLREIFQYFIAIDENGPFILILLSTYWQTFVLSSPSFWTYIYISDEVADLDARLETFAVLSMEQALHITIRMPYNSAWNLQALLQRCLILTIDGPASSGPTETESRNEVLALAQVVAKHLLCSLPPTLRQIFWCEAGSPSQLLLTERDIKLDAKQDGERKLDINERYSTIPPLMITSLLIGSRQSLSFNDFHFILSKFWHLQDLQINVSTLFEPPNMEYKLMQLPFLQTISVFIPSESGAFWDILSHLRAPILDMATIRGNYDVRTGVVTASQLIVALRPRGISLDFQVTSTSSTSSTIPIQTLESIRYLVIKAPEITSKKEGYDALNQINQFVRALPNLQTFHLCINPSFAKCLEALSIPHGALHVSILPETYFWSRSQPTTYFDIGNSPQINKLEVNSGIVSKWEVFWCKPLSSARAIIIPNLAFSNRPPLHILIDPRYWSNKLQRLDLQNLIFSTEILQSQSAFSDLGPFTNLTEIRCMPQVIYPLLSRNLLPSLQNLILLPSDGEWGLSDFAALLLNMLNPPPLQTLGFLFYPEWKQLYQIIQHLLGRRSTGDLFSIKLPSLPHPNLLAQLVAVLLGGALSHPSEQLSPTLQDYLRINDEDGDSYMDERGCRYCKRSGWTCKEYYDICDRHSLNDLVTITQYTIS